MGNYSFKTTGLPEPVNGVVEGHNFTQGVVDTEIYTGQTGLTFRNCNLTNCKIPPDAIVEGSKYPRKVSYCSHNHPSWLEKSYIAECSTNCSHVVTIDNVTIDGVVVDQNHTYEDKAVS